LSTLNRLLTVVREHFGRKNKYRYLTYTTIIDYTFDNNKKFNKFAIYM